VQEIWKAVLKVDTVSVDDNFFDVGGHSLLMVQVHEQLQRVLHREFPLIALLRQPTIRSISEFLENSSGAQPAAITDQMARQRAALISHRNRVFKARVS
jgi:aryl carrier-like protein